MLSTEPRLSQFGPAFAWLLSREVTSTRLANLFHTAAGNVRAIAFRSRHDDPIEPVAELSIDSKPPLEMAASVGVRGTPDHVVRTPRRVRRLDELNLAIQQIVTLHARGYTFSDGVRALRMLAPQIGYASDARRIALSALLHHHLAWFLVHSGSCESAAREAHNSRTLWRLAYQESGQREYAESFIKSVLIGSHSLLLTRRPKQAWKLLQLATDAAASIGAPEGSDCARQRGVALFQLREDDRAAVQFEKSARAMESLNEATVPAQLLMTGARHTSLLGNLNWDDAQTVLDAARKTFGDRSLEASMALHWAAACGLSTDSSRIARQAFELIKSSAEPAAQFGHQLTIRRLLAITPDLGLDDRLRRVWVRRTLYENASRNR